MATSWREIERYACPLCGAGTGEACQTVGRGHAGRSTAPHKARRALCARAAGQTMADVGASYRYEALWQASARAAGWVPLADVLDALRRDGAFLVWFQTTNPDTYLDQSVVEQVCDYLAERFTPTAPEGADERNGHG